MSFPAYPHRIASGVEWLGAVPAHWSVTPIRMIARLESGHTPSRSRPEWWTDCTIPWFTLADVWQIREQGRKTIYETEERVSELGLENSSARLLPEGTVMLSRTASVGFSAIMGVDMATTQDFANWVCGPRLNNEFLLFVFKAMTAEFKRLRYGSTHNTIYMPDIAAFRLALPPIDEQAAITAFLDRETAKIDALVEEQRRLIALLKEKRQAVISHAVTKGLNPDAPMKDSGVEWLGEVPAHWVARSIASISTKITNGYVGPTRDILTESGVRYLQSLHIKQNKISFDRKYYVSQEWSNGHAKSILNAGDVLLVQTGDIGQCAVVTEEFEGCNCHALIIVSPVNGVVRGNWLSWVLNSDYGQQCLFSIQTGALHPHLNCGNVKSVSVPLPPIPEQLEIVDFIEGRLSRYADLIEAAEQAIALLAERRSGLISAAVTGKIDVRSSAEVLPFPLGRVRARGLIATEIIERSARQATFGRVKLQKIAYLAEAHAGVTELEGAYLREAAGPLDRDMILEMEREAGVLADVRVEQPNGVGSAVTYQLGDRLGAHRQDLAALLGDRAAKFDKLVADIGTIETKGTEAVATLYAVWNDALIDGDTPADMEIKLAVLSEWHPEKADKFTINDLQIWLDWMRRHGIVPTGAGPKTTTGRLFA